VSGGVASADAGWGLGRCCGVDLGRWNLSRDVTGGESWLVSVKTVDVSGNVALLAIAGAELGVCVAKNRVIRWVIVYDCVVSFMNCYDLLFLLSRLSNLYTELQDCTSRESSNRTPPCSCPWRATSYNISGDKWYVSSQKPSEPSSAEDSATRTTGRGA
jgi:hypothetical protein